VAGAEKKRFSFSGANRNGSTGLIQHRILENRLQWQPEGKSGYIIKAGAAMAAGKKEALQDKQPSCNGSGTKTVRGA